MSTLSRVLARKINLFLSPTCNRYARPCFRAPSCFSPSGLFPAIRAAAGAFSISNKFTQGTTDRLPAQHAVGCGGHW